MIWQAVWAGFGYFQREAGYTRTGSHHARVNGRETGQWHEADLAVAHWLQHTSRDGDMQLHVHSQIAHIARTSTDGKWRAPDSLGYNEHIGAVAAITAQHLEEALTRRFGLEWVARDDGHGFEIKGISGEMMRLFSSRRESITADLRDRAARFEQRYGRAPSQRELAQLAQASNFATRKAKEGALDFAQLHAGWADKLARTLGVPLASVAPSVWHATAQPPGPDARSVVSGRARAGPRRAEGGRAGAAGKEHLDPRRPGQVPGPGAAQDRQGPGRGRGAAGGPGRPRAALGVRAGAVPGGAGGGRGSAQPAARRRAQRLPAARRRPVRHPRAAGHGRTHASRRRSAGAAPRMTRADAARALGADLARLEHALAGRAHDAQDQRTGRTGLREDQAAAALSVLTDGKRVSVINAPGRVGQDPGAGRGRPGLGGGRARPGHRHHRVAVRPQHPGRRGDRVLQHRPVPRPPARPARRPRPARHQPRAPCWRSTRPR